MADAFHTCSRMKRVKSNNDQETLNYWKQTSHVLKYFRAEEEPKARLPSNFINGFLEVCDVQLVYQFTLTVYFRAATEQAPNP
jgi:hypothetical protein